MKIGRVRIKVFLVPKNRSEECFTMSYGWKGVLQGNQKAIPYTSKYFSLEQLICGVKFHPLHKTVGLCNGRQTINGANFPTCWFCSNLLSYLLNLLLSICHCCFFFRATLVSKVYILLRVVPVVLLGLSYMYGFLE